MLRTQSVAVPATSHVRNQYAMPDLADAYRIRLPENASADPERLANHLFDQSPRWVGMLMRVRDALVSVFGLKTASSLRSSATQPVVQRIGIFRIYSRHANEIILGEDDRHLDFRLSVMHDAAATGEGSFVTVATTVECHNRLGRTYLAVIAPFHRAVVRGTLRQAARTGWPAA